MRRASGRGQQAGRRILSRAVVEPRRALVRGKPTTDAEWLDLLEEIHVALSRPGAPLDTLLAAIGALAWVAGEFDTTEPDWNHVWRMLDA